MKLSDCNKVKQLDRQRHSTKRPINGLFENLEVEFDKAYFQMHLKSCFTEQIQAQVHLQKLNLDCYFKG
jgi:hypothetical protein